jgi:hypothetical protein
MVVLIENLFRHAKTGPERRDLTVRVRREEVAYT